MFFEMRFDLGTLDSGERSLPFGLLVFGVFLSSFLFFLSSLLPMSTKYNQSVKPLTDQKKCNQPCVDWLSKEISSHNFN